MHTLRYLPKTNTMALLVVSMLAISMIPAGSMLANVQTAGTAPMLSKISALLADELATQGDAPLRLLVETFSSSYESLTAEITRLGGSVNHEFKYTKAIAVTLPRDKVMALAEHENVKQISLDELQYPSGFKEPVDKANTKNTVEYLGIDKDVFDARKRYTTEGKQFVPGPEFDYGLTLGEALEITLTPEQIMQVNPTTYWSPVSMNALGVWQYGYYGEGSLAVIIDTGVYADHFMLEGNVIGGIDISADVDTPYEGWSSPENHWHGTHCAGILAGHGAILVRSNDPLYKAIAQYATPPQEASSLGYPGWHIVPLTGMAPLAQIYAVKVFPHDGSGAPTSTIMAGVEYAIDMKLLGGYDVDVISMSLGGGTVYDGRHPEDQLVDYASSLGITVSVSAGNDGPAAMTVGRPGTANTAITTAAAATPVDTRVYWDYVQGKPGIGHQLFTSDTPQVYEYSSRGPTSDGRDKPDMSATGIMVLSAMPDADYPQGLGWASGTSMACPAVSGTVALLAGFAEHNYGVDTATPEDFKQSIMAGAVWLPGYDKYDQGSGYLNAGNALYALLMDTLGSVATPLPPTGTLMDITNIPIVGQGVYTDSIVDLKPGMNRDYIFTVTEATDCITLEVTHVRRNIRDPYDMNSFEVYIGSATRTTYAYYIDSANVWGNAQFVVTDYTTSISGAVTGPFYDEFTRWTIIESGYVKITIENDWTSSGRMSCDIKITVTESPPPTPDLVYTGTVAQDEFLRVPSAGYIYPPAGTAKVAIELWWENDWTTYPSTDLDALVRYYNGTHWNWIPDVSLGTMNSPERTVINGPVVAFYIWIYGYEVHPGPTEPWTIKLYYS